MKDGPTTWHPIAPSVRVTYYGGTQYLVSTRTAPVILVRAWQGIGVPVPDRWWRYARFGDHTGEGWYGLWSGDRDAPGFHDEQKVRRSRDPRLRHLARPWQLLVPPPPNAHLLRDRLAELRDRVRRDAS